MVFVLHINGVSEIMRVYITSFFLIRFINWRAGYVSTPVIRSFPAQNHGKPSEGGFEDSLAIGHCYISRPPRHSAARFERVVHAASLLIGVIIGKGGLLPAFLSPRNQ